MQLIDFRKANCEVYIGTYNGVDCDFPTAEPKRTVVKYTNVGGIISASIAKNIVWDDRVIETYAPTQITDWDIPAAILSELLQCPIPTDYDSEITCVEENNNLYIIRFSEIDSSYIILDFNGVDVTWTVTPIKCDTNINVALRSSGFFCVWGLDTVERIDVIDTSVFPTTVLESFWQDITGTVIPTPLLWTYTPWACSVWSSTVSLTPINCLVDWPNVKECNSDDILNAILALLPVAPTLYNTEEIVELTAGATQTFPASSIHSISFVVLAGTADVQVGATTITGLPSSFSDKYEASTLLANAITVTASLTGRTIVTTIA